MMRDLLISEFQDGHALMRLMFMTALVAASWFMFRPEMKKPPGGLEYLHFGEGRAPFFRPDGPFHCKSRRRSASSA
jgi:hypothetical protein